jgi:hypothetical protein
MWTLIFKGLTARRLYKSFGVKGLISGISHVQRRHRFDQFALQSDRTAESSNVVALSTDIPRTQQSAPAPLTRRTTAILRAQ